ncbi:MAG: glycosyltransferase family 39 protein, partial [Opitutales bacterium]
MLQDPVAAPTLGQPTPRWVWLAVVALLALYASLTLSASMQKGVSFDETEQLGVGYDIWLHHDFRMEGANGDFVKRWATLPFLITQPAFPGTDEQNWREGLPYGLGHRFLFQSGNSPEYLLLQSRLMIVLLGLATGLLVFGCSREIFGPVGGLLSLSLFVFCPHMLAYGALVSTEMSVCLALLGSIWSIWRLLQQVTWGRLFLSLLFLALLFLCKLSAMVIFPIAALLIGVKLLSRRPLQWRLFRPRTIHSRAAQAGIFFALFLVHGLWCWTCLWAHYDFRYASSPNPADPAIASWLPANLAPVAQPWRDLLSWSRDTHLLPAGYLDGIQMLLAEKQARLSFFDGSWAFGGSHVFFPYAIWAKTSPILFLLILLAAAFALHRSRQNRLPARPQPAAPAAVITPAFYDIFPYLALVAVFLAVAIAQNLDIAHRHILPIYPPVYILVGGFLGLAWLSHRRLLNTLIALLLVGYAGESLALYPNYLTYFSPSVGGPSQGYKRLVDSSLDWGMDLPALKHWLDRN